MQQDNIDLVQQVYSAYMAGDRETVTRLLSPDIVWHNSGLDPTAGTRTAVGARLSST